MSPARCVSVISDILIYAISMFYWHSPYKRRVWKVTATPTTAALWSWPLSLFTHVRRRPTTQTRTWATGFASITTRRMPLMWKRLLFINITAKCRVISICQGRFTDGMQMSSALEQTAPKQRRRINRVHVRCCVVRCRHHAGMSVTRDKFTHTDVLTRARLSNVTGPLPRDGSCDRLNYHVTVMCHFSLPTTEILLQEFDRQLSTEPSSQTQTNPPPPPPSPSPHNYVYFRGRCSMAVNIT